MAEHAPGLNAGTLETILRVTRKLAAPFDLQEMLEQVVDAGIAVLSADRGSVFLYEEATDELVGYVTTGTEALRIPAGKGIAGECARTREVVNVPDCYADPRFNPEVDRKTRYRTRCLIAVPLIGHDDSLVGVMQLLNKRNGTFGEEDEKIARTLAAQCAVALQRVRMTEELLVKEKMQRELAVAREIQMGFLPGKMPDVAGYDLGGISVPADETGGDTFDVVASGAERIALLLGDATGHGIGPALSATQVRAMLRIALRLGAGVEDTLVKINDQLEQDLALNRFVTAFLGTLDPQAHQVTYHAAGQAPLMHYHAAADAFEWLSSTTLPLGLMAPLPVKPAATIDLAPGDILGLMTDGVFECEDPKERPFGEEGVARLVRQHRERPMSELVDRLFEAVETHAAGAAQADDVTIVLVRRLPG
jgi:phosphoserine phosphatase